MKLWHHKGTNLNTYLNIMPPNSNLEKIIFDIQISIPRVHPVQISSRFDYCIATDIMWKYTKNEKKVSNNSGLVFIIKSEPDLSWTYGFHEVLDDVKSIAYMIFQSILTTGCRNIGKETNFFWWFFFENWTLSLLYPYGALTAYKKL